MTVESEFSIEEKDAIKELRKRIKGEIDNEMYEDSYLFHRFLKARDFNVDAAESMLRKHLEWRIKHDIKNALKFKKLEVMKYVSNDILGYDKDGCVVRYCPVGNIDAIGLNASCKFEDLIKLLIYYTEEDTMKLKKQSEKFCRNIDKCVYIYNMENLSFATATDKQSVYFGIYLLNLYQNNYPERLKAAYILNVSTYFHFIFSMLKPFLAKALLEKIRLYSDGSFKTDLLNVIDDDVLPAFLGGTRTDPDGNPMCTSFLNPGGKVPESYYLPKNKKLLSKSPGVSKVTLPRAAFHEVIIHVKEPNSSLEWEFETKCRDIGFGLFYQDTSSGEEKNVQIIPLQRIDTDISSEVGTFKCDKVGAYVVVFDNTYSWIRSKDIYYRIKVLTTKEQEEQLED